MNRGLKEGGDGEAGERGYNRCPNEKGTKSNAIMVNSKNKYTLSLLVHGRRCFQLRLSGAVTNRTYRAWEQCGSV